MRRDSLHPDTLERHVDTFAIPADIAPERIEIGQRGELFVSCGGTMAAKACCRRSFCGAPRSVRVDRGDRLGAYGTGRCVTGGPPDTDLPRDRIRRYAPLRGGSGMSVEYGFALASGEAVTLEATRDLATRIGYVRETIFGGMWDFTANLAFKDTAYTSAAIGPHTDGTYSLDSPGFQMFHCLHFDGSGGESTLVDGFKVAEDIRRSDPLAFEVLASVRVPAHYSGDGVHLTAGASDHRSRRSWRAGADRLQ